MYPPIVPGSPLLFAIGDPKVNMLAGKNILVTGGSSGLGAHFAKLLADNGAARIALAARRTDHLEQIRSDILSARRDVSSELPIVTCVKLDVTDLTSIRSVFDTIEKEWKLPADVVINNAGISISNSFLKVSEQEYDTLMDVNLKGAFFVCQEAARRMIEAKLESGSIINVASILGLRVGRDLSTYAISKAGIIQMTKAAALELSRHNVRVNCICPGYIRTEINAKFFDTEKGKEMIQKKMLAKRLGRPEELDGAILLLSSKQSSFMTGSVITVDGGHVINGL